MDHQEALDKYLINQVSIYPPFFSPMWIRTSNFNPTIYADKIFYYENVVFHPDQVILSLEESDPSLTESDAISKWKPWISAEEKTTPLGEVVLINERVLGDTKTTSPKKYLSSSSEVQFVFGHIKNSLTFTTDHYIATLGLEPAKMSMITISKYNEGAELGPHTDYYMNSSYLSAVLYLNDNYEGGELYFPDQDVRIKPSAGSIVVFPSTDPFSHQSEKIISGEKYISSVFLI
jgi:hypothetical protein